MRLLIVYRPKSEHSRLVEEFIHEFTRLHPDKQIDLLDADSVEAQDTIRIYDVVLYPALLVLANDGQLQKMWSGPTLPLMNEVLGYLNV